MDATARKLHQFKKLYDNLNKADGSGRVAVRSTLFPLCIQLGKNTRIPAHAPTHKQPHIHTYTHIRTCTYTPTHTCTYISTRNPTHTVAHTYI